MFFKKIMDFPTSYRWRAWIQRPCHKQKPKTTFIGDINFAQLTFKDPLIILSPSLTNATTILHINHVSSLFWNNLSLGSKVVLASLSRFFPRFNRFSRVYFTLLFQIMLDITGSFAFFSDDYLFFNSSGSRMSTYIRR